MFVVGAAFQPRFSRRSQSCFGEVGSSRLKASFDLAVVLNTT
jgi:hypothetical protein